MLRPPRTLVLCLALAAGAHPLAAQRGSDGADPGDEAPFALARFRPHPAEGDAPLSVRFEDRSLGQVTSWRWEFGDGTSSAEAQPVHVYSEGGVYDVRLTIRGPAGSNSVTRRGAVSVRRCSPGSVRTNRVSPLERGEDFVPITGDDSAGFYCVYSGKAIGPDNPGISNNVAIFLLPLAGGEVLVFGSGYGDENWFVTPTESAGHDAHRVDALLRFCLGRTPESTPLRFVAPHGHIDHINADFIRELRRRGYPLVDIAFHAADATSIRALPGWTQADRNLFRTLRNGTGQCQEELTSFASPLGRIWFHLRDGHTAGSIDLVIDVGNDPDNRFVVRGSGGDFGSCSIPGVREAIEPHGNVLLTAPPPRVSAISPASASSLGGTLLSVSGSGFAAKRAGPPTVLVDGIEAGSVTVLADDLLTCRAPAGLPGDVSDVSVTNRNGRAVFAAGLRYRELPTLTAVTPAHGFASGGTRVTLTGSGFQAFFPGTNRVTFGGLQATSLAVVDDRTLSCTVPPHAAGPVAVQVANDNGSAQLATGFRYDPLLDVTGLTPAQGTSRGGTRVQIQGSAFTVGARVPDVLFGTAPATDVVRVSNTRLDCTTPPGPAGTQVDVRVSGDNGSDTLAAGFRYFVGPSVSSLSPASGPAAGGGLVTLTGNNFLENNAGPNTVAFGSVLATQVLTLSGTSIQCRVPAGTSGRRVDIVVDNANGTGRLANGYRYHRVPAVASLEPAHGPREGDTLVTLRGSGFLETGAGATLVLFGDLAAGQVTVRDDATLTCRTPAHPTGGSVDVEVRNGNGAGELAQAFRFVIRPRLSRVDPAEGTGRGGTLVTLSGSGFRATGAGATEVRFGRAQAEEVRVLDDRTVTCRTPVGLPEAHVDVRLVNQNGAARLPEAFAFLPLPGLSGVTPSSGPITGGTPVRLRGHGFAGGAQVPRVFFGTARASAVTVLSDDALACVAPAAPLGLVDVRVETAGGSALIPGAYVYGPTRPTLSAVLPEHGPSGGGNLVELVGTNFASLAAGANAVTFGGVPATGVVTVNDELVRCLPPAGAPGSVVNVRLTNANGSVTRTAGYRYHQRPALTGLAPSFGSPLGGTEVTLRGSGFLGDGNQAHEVRFGAALASEVRVLDDATLLCRSPAGTPGAWANVSLSTANGSALLANAFRYQAAPTLQSLTPSAGTPRGGTPVTLRGTGFALEGAGTTRVLFGSKPATQVTVLGDTDLSCLSPVMPPGSVLDVRLENGNGSARLPAAFQSYAAPLVTSASPGSGPAAGGTTVVILGSGFRTDVLGPNSVTFGGLPARSVTSVDDTRVRAVSPTGTAGTTVEVVLANSNGTALVPGGFRYHAEPVLGTCTPGRTSALGGATITLRGSGFQRDAAGPPSVLFGATPAGLVNVLDDETLTCLAPPGEAGSTVVVTLSNRNGGATCPSPFQYNPAPRLDGLTPAHGYSGGGTRVELRGAGFLANEPGTNSVWFGANRASAVTVLSDSSLECRAPAGAAGPVQVRVENTNGGSALADGYFYDWAPTLAGIEPAQGTSRGGTLVTLTGGGFATAGAGALSVRFGTSAATGLRVIDGQRLECNAPPGPAGSLVSVTVANSRGSSSLAGYRYHPRPTLTGVDPPNGPPEGATPVTLRGTGFRANEAGTPTVRFGTASATGVTVVDDATVHCLAPAGPARTSATVTLSNANGSDSLVDGYRWLVREPTDLDADGISDAVIAATDGLYVYFGSPLGPANESTSAADLVLRSSTAGTDFGAQVASGDLNGDRIPDLAVGAPLDDSGGTNAGAVYVFLGPLLPAPTPRLASSASASFRGAASGDRFGWSLAIGDVSGDLHGDLVVGAPFNNAAGEDGGAVYVYRGSAAFVGQTTTQAAARLLANGAQHSFGAALAVADVTGDGRADVVVGAPLEGATGAGSGALYVFRGGAPLVSGTASSALVQLGGASSGDAFGTSVAAADFDGDGTDDLFAGAPEAKIQGTQAGSVFAFRGGAGLESSNAGDAAARYDGEDGGDRFGHSLSLGDANGDGRADLLCAAPQHDVPATNAGRAYLVQGGSFLGGAIASRAHMILLAENSAGDQFGAGLGAIDIDGDGRVELLVGAPFSNGGGSDSGRLYVFLGSALQATRSAGADDATITGASASFLLGREIGSAH